MKEKKSESLWALASSDPRGYSKHFIRVIFVESKGQIKLAHFEIEVTILYNNFFLLGRPSKTNWNNSD